jgi:aromatic-L-amino-acid decarboxylase
MAADVQSKIVPGVTHWQSPNFFGYYPSNGSTAGFLGEMLSGGFNIVGFSWITSPAATELEMIVLDWLGKLLQLPNEFLSSGKQLPFKSCPLISTCSHVNTLQL